MKHDYDVRHLNIAAFAMGQGKVEGTDKLVHLDRLAVEAQGSIDSAVVQYTARGMTRIDGTAGEQSWLALTAEVAMPLICQRCLGPVDVPVQVEREFRFVATEEIAEAQDEDSEEDVLVLSRDFNLLELIEDELLMALPVVPKHTACPGAVKLCVADPDFAEDTAEKPNPFAVLERLKKKP
jgi:uncharacterized protein